MEKLRSSSRLGPQPCFENQKNKTRQIEEMMGGRKEWMGIDSNGYQREVTLRLLVVSKRQFFIDKG